MRDYVLYRDDGSKAPVAELAEAKILAAIRGLAAGEVGLCDGLTAAAVRERLLIELCARNMGLSGD